VGLRHPSTARMSNIVAVDKKLIKRVLRTLHAEDLARIELGLRAAFGLSAASRCSVGGDGLSPGRLLGNDPCLQGLLLQLLVGRRRLRRLGLELRTPADSTWVTQLSSLEIRALLFQGGFQRFQVGLRGA
jgi:hypothetical protein